MKGSATIFILFAIVLIYCSNVILSTTICEDCGDYGYCSVDGVNGTSIVLIYCSNVILSTTICEDCGDYGYCSVDGVNGTCDTCTCPSGGNDHGSQPVNGTCCEILPANSCNSNTCPSSNFTCVNYPVGQYECVCVEGWTGANCDTEIDPCNPNPCGYGASQCLNQPNGTASANSWYCDSIKNCYNVHFMKI
uniref:EGF-like domain-containing protein n=1 Tax=Acrobeloides nanus TaxID=290746 RepID=A0A914C6I8_9BILA